MRIVKKGNLDKEFFFECKDCECVFALTGKELMEMKREHTNPDGTVSPWDVVCPECGNMSARNIEAPTEACKKSAFIQDEQKNANPSSDNNKDVVSVKKRISLYSKEGKKNCPYAAQLYTNTYKNGVCVADKAEDWCMEAGKKCPTGGKTEGGICKYL